MKITESLCLTSQLPQNVLVKVTTAGNTVNIKYVSNKNVRANILKQSQDEYIVVSTGELKTIEHTVNRSQNINSLRKTLAKLRDLINANVTDLDNILWVTLTYAENMTDTTRLYKDSHNYHKKLKRYFESVGVIVPEYIEVVEPQERGAWHIHEILIWNEKAPFFPNSRLRDLWGQGFVMIKKVQGSCDNFGAYLTPYLTDLVIDDTRQKTTVFSQDKEKEIETIENGEKKRKKVIKGQRLFLYPPGMQIYRHSRGIKSPIVETMTYEDALKKVSGAAKTFEKTVTLEEDSFKSTVYNAYYNTKR